MTPINRFEMKNFPKTIIEMKNNIGITENSPSKFAWRSSP